MVQGSIPIASLQSGQFNVTASPLRNLPIIPPGFSQTISAAGSSFPAQSNLFSPVSLPASVPSLLEILA